MADSSYIPDPADVELLARRIYDDAHGVGAYDASHRIGAWHEEARNHAASALAFLAELGRLLPPCADSQFSVCYPDGFVLGTWFTLAGARQRAAEVGGEVVSRQVGPWQPVPTGPETGSE